MTHFSSYKNTHKKVKNIRKGRVFFTEILVLIAYSYLYKKTAGRFHWDIIVLLFLCAEFLNSPELCVEVVITWQLYHGIVTPSSE